MNTYIKYILPIALLASCKEEDVIGSPENPDVVELKGVIAEIAGNTTTRAAALDAYNYVGRSAFIHNDVMVLTTIKRTESPINGFTYSGIEYKQEIETGQTSGGWNRDMEKGYSLKEDGTQNSEHPERIYWSDSHNPHTYIGYSLPKQPEGMSFDWNYRTDTYESSVSKGIKVYYGSLGNPYYQGGIIDYTNDAGDEGVKDDPSKETSAISKKSGNNKIMRDDLLLTYDTEKVAEIGGSVAKLSYHHALAMVRVVVNIQGFSASTDAADSKSVVKDMVLKDMLTLYKWRQQSFGAEALDAAYDTDNINAIYNDEGRDIMVHVDQKKDVHMWIPRPLGTGTGVGKQFTFYGLAVPRIMGVDNASTDAEKEKNLHFAFNVKYPDPMNPDTMVTKTYNAMMPNSVEFRAGYCTTINISLNHSNEQMTVGAEYMDWQMVETPDQGELKKGSTFLSSADFHKVTIATEEGATQDDATWLYLSDKGGASQRVLDIYGNDGTENNPFLITTAEQLLSFAKEVKNGRSFAGQYIKLDADITMQESLEILHDASGFYTLNSEGNRVAAASGVGVTWPGIGDKDHLFNGVFNGGYRHVNKLYGASFFNTIGEDGVVDHLFISNALGITGRGSIAEVNHGVICGAYIEGDVEAINVGDVFGSYCGSIVGENHSMLISCAHIGDIKGSNYETVGALLGYNDGIVAICYNCGNVTSTGSGVHTYAGIGKYTPRSIAYCSYYNGDLYKGQDYRDLNARIGHVAYPLTTAMMQSNVFVNKEATASDDGMTTTGGEIIDAETQKTDPFFFHLSLNGGIERAVVMLKDALYKQSSSDEIIIHQASTVDDANPFAELKLKKSLVKWLIDHYSYQSSDDVDNMANYEITHKFQFIPGTYPKLQ